jgi:hypothetical protein
MAATVVVSPHLADAVLSCWAVLDTDAEHPAVRGWEVPWWLRG